MRRAPVASLLVVAALAAACGASTPSSEVGTSLPSVTASAAATVTPPASQAPTASDAPATAQPTATPPPSSGTTPTPDSSAGATPSSDPSASATPTASGAAGPADACSGSAQNRAFYANLDAAVTWSVYCAVLPKGWYVASGSYRLANGGQLAISYKGPGGASLSLSEGSFCTDGSGCVPSGSSAGSAMFGDMNASLVATDGGGFAIVAAQGATPSWLMVTSGLDQATTLALGAALAHVGG